MLYHQPHEKREKKYFTAQSQRTLSQKSFQLAVFSLQNLTPDS